MSDKHICPLCSTEKRYNNETSHFEFPCGHEELVNKLWSQAVKEGGDTWRNRNHVDRIFQQLLQSARVEHATAPLLAIIKRQQQELAIAAELLEVEKAKSERYKKFVSDMRPMFINLEGVTCIYFGFGTKPTPIITPLRPDKMLECWQEITEESADS